MICRHGCHKHGGQCRHRKGIKRLMNLNREGPPPPPLNATAPPRGPPPPSSATGYFHDAPPKGAGHIHGPPPHGPPPPPREAPSPRGPSSYDDPRHAPPLAANVPGASTERNMPQGTRRSSDLGAFLEIAEGLDILGIFDGHGERGQPFFRELDQQQQQQQQQRRQPRIANNSSALQ